MLSTLTLIASLVVATPDASAWTSEDTYAEAGFAAVALLDWQQTRWAMSRPEFAERNPVLGSHPSMLKLDTLALGAIAGHAVVSYLLPRPYRETWQYTSLILEVVNVGANAVYTGGLRFKF